MLHAYYIGLSYQVVTDNPIPSRARSGRGYIFDSNSLDHFRGSHFDYECSFSHSNERKLRPNNTEKIVVELIHSSQPPHDSAVCLKVLPISHSMKY